METSNDTFFEDTWATMERATSSRTDLPPWERANMAQVPYMDAASASLSSAEREALPALWATQSNTVTRSKGDFKSHTPSHSGSRRTLSASSSTQTPDRAKTPMTAPLFHSNKPVHISAGPKTEPNLPTFVVAPKSNRLTHSSYVYPPKQQPVNVDKGPPTPPASDVGSWSTPSAHSSPKPYSMPPSPPPPVSSWNSSIDTSPESTHKCACQHRKRPSRITRWKSALKDFFHPVDDSDLEHIETSHWTEQ